MFLYTEEEFAFDFMCFHRLHSASVFCSELPFLCHVFLTFDSGRCLSQRGFIVWRMQIKILLQVYTDSRQIRLVNSITVHNLNPAS